MEDRKTAHSQDPSDDYDDVESHEVTRVAGSDRRPSYEGKGARGAGDRSASSDGKKQGVLKVSKNAPTEMDKPKGGAMEVVVDHSLEKAMKILKRKLIKEGLFKELKSRRYYEKPSERKKRKLKESLKKIRKEEARARKNALLY